MYIYIIAAVLAVFATSLTILFFVNDKKKSAKITELDDEKWQIMLAYTKCRARYAAKINHLNNLLPKLDKLQRQSFKNRIQSESKKNINLYEFNRQKAMLDGVDFRKLKKEYLKKMEHRKIHSKRIDYTKIINICLTCDKEKCNGDCAEIKKATKEFFRTRPKTKKKRDKKQ